MYAFHQNSFHRLHFKRPKHLYYLLLIALISFALDYFNLLMVNPQTHCGAVAKLCSIEAHINFALRTTSLYSTSPKRCFSRMPCYYIKECWYRYWQIVYFTLNYSSFVFFCMVYANNLVIYTICICCSAKYFSSFAKRNLMQ